MKKIISISLDEKTIRYIDKARGLVPRSKFIETMITIEELIKTAKEPENPENPENPEKSI